MATTPSERADYESYKFGGTQPDKIYVKTSLTDSDGESIDIQTPLPVDGDSVYCKDINSEKSDIGDFSGVPCDLFNDIFSEVANITSSNPKIIKIVFNRTIEAHSIGIGCLSTIGDFSNVVLKLIDGSGNIRKTIDDNTNNTKYKSFDYKFTPEKFDGIIFEFHTTDSICMTNVVIKKSVNVTSRIEAVSELTEEVESINSFRGALNVNPAWVHRKIVNETFHRETGVNSDLAVAASAGDTSMTLVSSTGFVIGNEIKICEGSIQEIGLITVTNIVGNVLTLDRPLANDYTIGLNICQVTSSMNVVGSLASPIEFEIRPPAGTIWQITRLLISIADGSPMDDGLFGSLSSLTNGVVLGAVTEADREIIYGNWKNNGDIKLDMYDVEYSDKAPAGEYGLRGRWSFTKAEVIAEIDGDEANQKLKILIQDDLSDLTNFRIKAQGRVFSP